MCTFRFRVHLVCCYPGAGVAVVLGQAMSACQACVLPQGAQAVAVL